MADHTTGPAPQVPTDQPDFADRVYAAAQQPGQTFQQALAYFQQLPGRLRHQADQMMVGASPVSEKPASEQMAALTGGGANIEPPAKAQGRGAHEPAVADAKAWVKPVAYHIEDRHLNAHDTKVELAYEKTVADLRQYQQEHNKGGHDALDADQKAPSSTPKAVAAASSRVRG
jgi:hypothetical protein